MKRYLLLLALLPLAGCTALFFPSRAVQALERTTLDPCHGYEAGSPAQSPSLTAPPRCLPYKRACHTQAYNTITKPKMLRHAGCEPDGHV